MFGGPARSKLPISFRRAMGGRQQTWTTRVNVAKPDLWNHSNEYMCAQSEVGLTDRTGIEYIKAADVRHKPKDGSASPAFPTIKSSERESE
jgi:hypothetical protein